MSRPPRGLSPEEAAAWQQVAASVVPLEPIRARKAAAEITQAGIVAPPKPQKRVKGRVPPMRVPPPPKPLKPSSGIALNVKQGLDPHWERRLARGGMSPDFTLDLHGCTLDQAHGRLQSGLTQAKAMGARVVLLITGKSRPVDAADRGIMRGAIRAKVLDWLAIGSHGSDISAIRKAHRRHGGEGALYILLKRR